MNLKFQTKMRLAFSFVIILTITSFILFIEYQIYPRLRDEVTDSNMQLCLKVSENVDNYVERLDDVAKKIISNATLLSILSKVNAGEADPTNYEVLTFNRELASVISNAITLTSFPPLNVFVFSGNGQYSFAYNTPGSNLENLLTDEKYLRRLESKRLVVYPHYAQNQYTLSFIRTIYDIQANKYGYVELQVPYSEIDQLCNINLAGQVYLEDSFGDKIYPVSFDKPIPEAIGKAIDSGGKSGSLEAGDDGAWFYTHSGDTGIVTIIRYSTQNVYASLQLLHNVAMLMCAVVTILAILLAFQFTRMLVKPLHELRDSVLNVTYDNMGLSFQDTTANEILSLKDAFQKILNDLKVSVENEIAASEAETKARLSSLQAQISPHFIHNMLYMISICAQEQRTNDVVAMCKQLSDMLRYTVNLSSETVTLREEMACIENYLSLQSKYYEDFLEYSVEWNRSQGQQAIPRLSLLTFVENSIHHAFNNRKPPYRISVSASIVVQSHWSVTITDNGRGFTPETVENISRALAQGRETLKNYPQRADSAGMNGMGILNSLLRLSLLYDRRFSYEIGNAENGGARIRLEGDLLSGGEGGMSQDV